MRMSVEALIWLVAPSESAPNITRSRSFIETSTDHHFYQPASPATTGLKATFQTAALSFDTPFSVCRDDLTIERLALLANSALHCVLCVSSSFFPFLFSHSHFSLLNNSSFHLPFSIVHTIFAFLP